MTRFLTATALLALLAACDDDQPLNFDGADQAADPPPPPPVVEPGEDPLNPEALPPVNGVFGPVAGDVEGGEFTDNGGPGDTLTVDITLDGDVLLQPFVRNPDIDVPGYSGFSQQDDLLDRAFTAFGGQSANGDARAIVAADAGQFNELFQGVTYESEALAIPTSGLTSYAGTYVGLDNSPSRAGLPDVSPDTDAGLPRRSTIVTGDVFINVDFSSNAINGAISNRQEQTFNAAGGIAGSVAAVNPELVLIPGDIDASGNFTGAVEADSLEVVEDPDNPGEFLPIGTPIAVGTYAGIFGGANAEGLAGGLEISNFDPNSINEMETGIFVVDQCIDGGPAAVCAGVDNLGE